VLIDHGSHDYLTATV